MESNKCKPLSGENNARLNQMDCTNNQMTAARANVDAILDETQVTVPSEMDVVHAKEWVDDGSRL